MRFLGVMVLMSFLLVSCETIKGAGRDIENAGEAIDDALDD
jgi:predicted small secreted protein